MKTHSGLIWITGFSSAGKTTVARKVVSKLKKLGYKTIHLDGNDLRNIFGNHWGYDRKSRIELASIYFHLCDSLSSQGYLVIISTISMFNELYQWTQKNIPNIIQVYLKVPRKERIARDSRTKKIFLKNEINDKEFDLPKNADLTVKNYLTTTANVTSDKIINYYLKRK